LRAETYAASYQSDKVTYLLEFLEIRRIAHENWRASSRRSGGMAAHSGREGDDACMTTGRPKVTKRVMLRVYRDSGRIDFHCHCEKRSDEATHRPRSPERSLLCGGLAEPNIDARTMGCFVALRAPRNDKERIVIASEASH
jgi:hypothetical protein